MDTALGILLGIRAEAVNFKEILDEIKTVVEGAPAASRTATMASQLSKHKAVFAHNQTQMHGLIREFHALMRTEPRIAAWAQDEITRVDNLWQRAQSVWPDVAETTDENLIRIKEIDARLRKIIFYCARLTIPERAAAHLEFLRIGRTLPFHDFFKDEVENEDDRNEILRDIALHAGVLKGMGVVDVENGLIFKASPDPWRRARSYVSIVGIVFLGALGTMIMVRAGDLFPLQDWPIPSSRLAEIIVAYLFLYFGALAHFGVDVVKKGRERKGKEATALEDVLLWVHVRETSILLGVAVVWVGLIGLIFTTPKIDWQLAFFVGYGIDSFADLFLKRFEATASAYTEKEKKRLSGDSEEA